ncbi:MAG: LuxR C-terminal-related transcriptional regulator [Planctomycetales bacterium]|nr:LuxR C-terminal-related transcriptional regulator [Planctomycetales bacterium]
MMLKDTTNVRAAGFAELQVMPLVTSGLPNKTVAHQLQLSVKTVEKHRGRLVKK